LPLVKIARPDSHSWIGSSFLPWLDYSTGIAQRSFYGVATCISEIFNNIQDHTNFDIGSIFAQHFPKEKMISISVSDFGDGIPHVVRTKLPNLSDSAAILTAVEGFTTKSNPRNQGAGLAYLLRTVALGHPGFIVKKLKFPVGLEESRR
jgi:anti-sigma regulatory factor (Ser/Thr protein kinase)